MLTNKLTPGDIVRMEHNPNEYFLVIDSTSDTAKLLDKEYQGWIGGASRIRMLALKHLSNPVGQAFSSEPEKLEIVGTIHACVSAGK